MLYEDRKINANALELLDTYRRISETERQKVDKTPFGEPLIKFDFLSFGLALIECNRCLLGGLDALSAGNAEAQGYAGMARNMLNEMSRTLAKATGLPFQNNGEGDGGSSGD